MSGYTPDDTKINQLSEPIVRLIAKKAIERLKETVKILEEEIELLEKYPLDILEILELAENKIKEVGEKYA